MLGCVLAGSEGFISTCSHASRGPLAAKTTALPSVSIRNFSNDDSNGNENVISKRNFPLLKSLRDYSKLFNMAMVWQALKNETDLSQTQFGGETENLSSSADVLLTSYIKLQIWLFHAVVLLTTAKKWTKMKNARAERVNLSFFPLNMPIFDVPVAVAVVVAKSPF